MARKYNQQQAGASYQGGASSAGFNALRVQTYDTSKQVEQKTKERNRDLKTKSDSLKRSYAVQSSQLSANKAKSDANFTALKGVLSLTKSGISAVQQINEIQKREQEEAEREAQEQAILDEQNNFLFGGETPRLDSAVEKEAGQDAAAYATSEAAIQVTDDPALQEDIVASTADALAARSTTRLNTYQAAASIGADLEAFMESDTIITLPDGKQIKASDARGSAELAAVASVGVQRLTKEYGLAGMDPKVLRQTYMGEARNAYTNAIRNRGRITRQAQQGERAVAHYSAASAAIQSGASPEDVYHTLYKSLKNSQVSIDPRKLNEMVRSHIISVAEGMGTAGIEYLESLKGVRQREGQKGTDLGKGPYAVEIDRAIRRIRTGAVSDFQATQQQNRIDIEKGHIQYQQDIFAAETEEERVRINEEWEAALEIQARAGNQTAVDLLQSYRSKDNRYNPHAQGMLMDRVARGEAISETEVREAVDNGSMTSQEGQAVLEAAGSNTIESTSTQLKPYQTGWTKQMESLINGALKNSGGSADRAETAIYAQDATRILNERMGAWMQSNPEASPAQIQQEAVRQSEAIVKERVTGELKEAQYNFDTPTVPTNTYTNPYTGQQARNLQHITTMQLQALVTDDSADNDIDIYNDILLTQDQFIQEVERMQAGQDFSPRIKHLARLAGVSPKSIMYGQAVGKGADLDSHLMKVEDSGNEPTDIVSGTRYLQSMGFTTRGAAYLSANIMQESSWDGMRDWGQVLGDGTSRNGGLISWASWSDDPARLGTIETYLGKPIDQATHSEQLRAMTWEMQKDYPNAYRVFTNPNATDAQLRRASFEYWGYGEEGNRFGAYLNQALDATNG